MNVGVHVRDAQIPILASGIGLTLRSYTSTRKNSQIPHTHTTLLH